MAITKTRRADRICSSEAGLALLLAVIAWSSAAGAQTPPMDFAGIKLGSAPEDLKLHLTSPGGRQRRITCSDQLDAPPVADAGAPLRKSRGDLLRL